MSEAVGGLPPSLPVTLSATLPVAVTSQRGAQTVGRGGLNGGGGVGEFCSLRVGGHVRKAGGGTQ